MKKSSFYFNGLSFVLGLLFGIFGVIFAFFAQTERRDKIYSSLLGCGIGAAISLVLFKYAPANL
jgi:hypothetical protein